jgi:hypothetical protein
MPTGHNLQEIAHRVLRPKAGACEINLAPARFRKCALHSFIHQTWRMFAEKFHLQLQAKARGFLRRQFQQCLIQTIELLFIGRAEFERNIHLRGTILNAPGANSILPTFTTLFGKSRITSSRAASVNAPPPATHRACPPSSSSLHGPPCRMNDNRYDQIPTIAVTMPMSTRMLQPLALLDVQFQIARQRLPRPRRAQHARIGQPSPLHSRNQFSVRRADSANFLDEDDPPTQHSQADRQASLLHR